MRPFPITKVEETSLDFFTTSRGFRKLATRSTMSSAVMPPFVPLFVYGSLKRGLGHHGRLKRAVRLGAASVTGCRLVLLDEYPALVEARQGRVLGELYRVDRVLMAELDLFEDCPALYRRRLVRLAGGTSAFAYFASDAHAQTCPPIAGEEWTD